MPQGGYPIPPAELVVGPFGGELQKKKLLNTVVDIVVIFCLIVISNSITDVSMDLFSVPILVIFATDLVKRIKISKLIIKIGQKSTNMWLIHTFFCYYYYPVAQLIYKPQYAILIWLLLMVLTYIASVLVDILYVKAGYIIKKILPKNKI